MKKLLISASLFANVVFLLLACQKENVTEASKKAVAANYETDVPAGPNAAASSSCSGATPSMPYNLVHRMIQNYRNNQQRAIENNLNIRDANACWFDLAILKNFICHLEEKVAESGCDNLQTLGLRFYYGAHTTTPTTYGSPANYARLHNLVIIPTYRNTNGDDVDFDPARVDKTSCKPIGMDLLRGDTSSSTTNIVIFAQDHGPLGPPDGPM
jgi:hypothetical protein